MKINKNIKQKKAGITLISLVVTIIVLLILAGISVTMIAGNNSILKQAGRARERSEKAAEEELVNMAVVSAQAGKYTGTDSNALENSIKASFGEEAKVDIVDDEITGQEGYIIKLPNGNVYPIGINNEYMDLYVPENDQSGNYDIKVIGYNIALNGKIGLVFYFTMPEEKINSGTETIKLIVEDEEETPQTINVSKSTISRGIINGEKCYYVEAWVPAKDMVNTVKFCAYNNNVQDSKEYSYSIKECGNELIRIIGTDSTNKKQEQAYYIKTMLNYGGNSQLLFNYKTSNLANEGIEVDTSSITDNYLDEYKAIRNGEQSTSCRVINIGCYLEEECSLILYLSIPNGDIDNYHPYIDNKEARITERADGQKMVVFDSTPLTESNRFYDFVIKDNEGNICGQSMKLCVFTFFRAYLRNGNAKAKEVGKSFVAMYNAYNQFIGK